MEVTARTLWTVACIVLCLGGAPMLMAQDQPVPQLGVDQAVAEALAHNEVLQNANRQLDGKQRENDLAFGRLYPSLSVTGAWVHLNDPNSSTQLVAYNPTAGNVYVTPDANNLMLQFNAQMVVSLATFQAIAQTRIDLDNARISRDLARQHLRRDVRKLFYQVLYLQEARKLAALQTELALRRREDSQNALNAGKNTPLDVLQASVAWENRKLAEESIEANREQVLYGFANLLGREAQAKLVLVGNLEPESGLAEISSEQLVSRYLAGRLDLQLAQGQIAALAGQKAILDASLLPVLALQYQADPTINNPFNPTSRLGDGANWHQGSGAFSLALSWEIDPFLPGSTYWNQQAALDDQTGIASNQLAGAQRAARTEIEALVQGIDRSKRLIQGLTRNVQAAQQVSDLSAKAYQAGTRSILEVQDADLQLQVAQLSLLGEQQNLRSHYIDLETALNATQEELYGKP